ncbi:ABC transporter ATP-binding protein [Thalassospira lucentensis]|uniref:ABC transporter ATP-binding protein n=1 Tax=Thalassospira lucentensis TaxID=168935 RepID=UPI0003B3354D|nr:ABC transporter ATP-binding protein [Thalassospira lucentensis]RCK20680.1 ABC transporter ATP-binding protein [Thalassospira lucentensis MCCC 1A00383 = DSM 14000]
MLEIKNLSVSYGKHTALRDISLTIDRGEIVVMLGANGAGKSSLLKACAGLVTTHDDTRISLAGTDLTDLSAHKIVEAGLALVPEGRGIFGELTVRENLELGAFAKRARAAEKQNLERVIDLFPKLSERLGQAARTMSGGEQQMVAIGRALMSNPDVLLLDEPSLGLSPIMTGDLFKALAAIRKTGVGVLLVEQNAHQSLAISDRGYLIKNGAITGQDTAKALQSDPAVQKAFLGLGAA